jgi:hypothetical protein
VRAGAAWPEISTSDRAISEDDKNPSTLDRARGVGGQWIAGYSDLVGR